MLELEEIWKVVPGFVQYEVSAAGEVRRIGAISRYKHGRKLKGWVQIRGGYRAVDLIEGGRRHRFTVHALVVKAFLEPKPSAKHEIAHWDGNPLNNAVSNLRWVTHTENIRDQLRHCTDNRGERNGNAKLTDQQVAVIRALPDAHSRIAAMFGVGRQTIGLIRSGHYRKHPTSRPDSAAVG